MFPPTLLAGVTFEETSQVGETLRTELNTFAVGTRSMTDKLPSASNAGRERPTWRWGIAIAMLIVLCGAVGWFYNSSTPRAGEKAVVVNTTVPPDAPPINAPPSR